MHAKSFVTLGLVAVLAATRAAADPEVHVPPTANPTFAELPPAIPLWPAGAPGSEGHTGPLEMRWEHFDTTWYPVLSSINTPALLPFLPAAGTATGCAVIVCPGGGHRFLAMEHEGYVVAKWLSDNGVAAFVLEYRLAKTPGSPYSVEVHALMDAQRAIRTVRSRAAAWTLNPAAIGIMGFSAGGELAALAATRYDTPVKGSSDALDAVDCRPDFQALFYPDLRHPRPPPTATSPVAFLCGASDDQFGLTPGLVTYYQALTAAGVPAELHVYAQGGHGFGIREAKLAVYSWRPLFLTWLRGGGFLSSGPPPPHP
jgi:acetyl esterase/lipase